MFGFEPAAAVSNDDDDADLLCVGYESKVNEEGTKLHVADRRTGLKVR